MKNAGKVILENTEVWELYSEKMEYDYEIRVALPKSAPPVEGYPVIYLLDGGSYFQFARDVVRLQSKNSPKTLVNDAIIVGIAHTGNEQDARTRRFYDFTAPAETYIYPERLQNADIGEHGGAEKFLVFLENELKPAIEKRYPINNEKQALFGHSLSGLFTLWALFTKPTAFQTYLACSPSIWWNEYELLSYMERFIEKNEYNSQRVHITVGEHERFMVDDAKKVAVELKERIHDVESELYIAPDENHASVVPTILSRAIRFACK